MADDQLLYPESASEVHVVVSELFSCLQVALVSWPPDSSKELAQLVNEVLSAADRLGKLGSKPRPTRSRRRWTAAETPPAVDPPSFPGPRRQRKKAD